VTASPTPPGGDFRMFLQKIAIQGFYALGLIEIPGAPPQQGPNLEVARMVLHDLKTLREKTHGNLDPGEEMTLEKYVADLEHALDVAERAARGSGGDEPSAEQG